MLLFSVENGAMNASRYWQQRNERSGMSATACAMMPYSNVETSVNTTRFSYPYGTMNFMP
jgi:hypothetical protein